MKKYLLIIPFLAIFLLPNFVSAQTTAELQAQIAALLAQIQQLQAQLAQKQGQPAIWCHNFNINLKIGDSGAEIEALQTALNKEGFGIDEKGNFDESTASAVSGFQQKFKDEILTSLRLQYGTGFVGKSTRIKLNQLYGCGAKSAAPISTTVCNIFLTCEGGYTPYNTDKKDSQGCPIIKCIPASVSAIPAIPIPNVSPNIPIIYEQVKCLFRNSASKQECYSSIGSSCAGSETCVSDVKGVKGEQITWKSTCGGYAYTTMDGNNEYAEFQCAASAFPTTPVQTPTVAPAPTSATIQTPIPTTVSVPVAPTACAAITCASGYTPYEIGEKDVNGCSVWKCSFISVLSPNGGEQWAKGSNQIIRWKSSPEINDVYMKLRKGSDTYPGLEGVVSPGVSNAGTNPGSHVWTIPTTLPDGNDYVIRIINSKGGVVYDDSDAPFSIITNISQNNPPKITGGSTLPPGGLQAGQTVNFSWNAQDEDNDNLVWSVNWGDGIGMTTACPASNPSNAQGWTLNIFHAWVQAGTYTVKVAVSDCKGGTDSRVLTVSVGAAAASSAAVQPLKALSAEIIGGQSIYSPGQTIKFSVKGIASDGSIAVPAKGFNVQVWMQKTNPIGETVQINGVYQSFNAIYDSNSGLWNATMTASSDTSQTYKIEGALYCADYSLGCSLGQINNSFTFNIATGGGVGQSLSLNQLASVLNSAQEVVNEITKLMKSL